MHKLLAIVVGICVYIILMRVFRKQRMEEEALSRRLSEVERKKGSAYQTQRQEVLDQPFFDRTIRPILENAGKKLKKVPGFFGRSQESERQLKLQLMQSGSTMQVTEYMALRVAVTSITTVLAVVIVVTSNMPALNQMVYLLCGIFGPYAVMRYMMTAKITSRRAKIEQQLPDVLDLMSVSVEAGLGFEQAIDYIVANMEGELIDELAVTSREISMGRSRKSAFLLLGERCGAETVLSFVSALVQAMDMGISMKVLLSSQAESMRLHRKRVMEEKAMKLSTKLLFPLIFFIFPAIFIVLLGPALMNIMNTL